MGHHYCALQILILTPFLRRTSFQSCKRYTRLTFGSLKNFFIFDKISSISLAFLRIKFSYGLLGWAEFDFTGERFFSKIVLRKSLLKENALLYIHGKKQLHRDKMGAEELFAQWRISVDVCLLTLKGSSLLFVNFFI